MRRIALVPLVGLVFAGCSDSAGPGDPVLTKIDIVPAAVFMTTTGQEEQLVAVGKDQHDNLLDGVVFSWSSDKPSVATVDQTGNVRAGRQSCVAHIRAAAPNENQKMIFSNEVSVTVQHASSSISSVLSSNSVSGCD